MRQVLGWLPRIAAVCVVVALLSVVALGPAPAGAGGATFTVTSTGDGPDANTADGVCDDGTGGCTLRAAIEQANASLGLDTIAFSIGTGVETISPASPLPPVMDPAVIDGTTQPGFAGKPIIELDGSLSGSDATGLYVLAGNSTVRGLVINGFSGDGVVLDVPGNNLLVGNFIGTNSEGTAAKGNFNGILMTAGFGKNVIGGTSPSDRNVLSGNTSAGVYVFGADENVIKGNYIGTDHTGLLALGNHGAGVVVNNVGAGNLIGGTEPGAGNVISGNGGEGLFLGLAAKNNIIRGNLIGTDVSGTLPLGNSENGILIFGEDGYNVIGGPDQGSGNVIANNGAQGVAIGEVGGNTVRGNSIHSNVDKGISAQGFGVVVPPVITSAGSASGTSLPNCIIDVYSDDEDEGRVYHGSTVANANGDWSLAGPVSGPNITATCTDAAGSTSEFSVPFHVGCDNDADCDAILDASDNCPLNPNPSQVDSDGDGLGDACDNDWDNDGVDDGIDQCLDTPPGATVDAAGCAQGQVDRDGDGVCDSSDFSSWCSGSDNCLSIANPGQEDTDGDGAGDACDPPGTGNVDCDGDIDLVDALKVLRYGAGLPQPQSEPCPLIGHGLPGGHPAGDVNCSGRVNAVDALIILRYVARLRNDLPPGCPPVGPSP